MNLLAAKIYDPAGAVSKATSALLALTAFDTTNLRLTVTIPQHGYLRVRICCNLSGATTMPQVMLGVLDGSTVRGRQVAMAALPGTAVATTNVPLFADFIISGLTPGSMTLDAAYGVETIVAATNIHYGGPNNTTANDAWGAFIFEIYDPMPWYTNGSQTIRHGKAQAGAAGTITLDASASAVADFYDDAIIAIVAGVGVGQCRVIQAYDGTTKVATISPNWGTTPDSTSIFSIIPMGRVDVGMVAGTAQTAGDLKASLNTIDDFVDTEIADIQARLPAALVGGRIDASVGAMAANVITASAINADAITAAKIADGAIDSATFAAGAINAAAIGADAITDAKVAADVTIASVTGAVGSVTGNVGGNVAGSVNSVATGVTVTTNNDKTGYGLSGAAVQAIWDALTAALTTVGSIGKKLADWTIGTAQTGDSFARLGAPAGASISADILVIDNLVDDLESRLGVPSDLGTGATVAANLVDIEAQTDDIGVAGAGLTVLATQVSVNTIQSDLDDIQAKIGTPAGASVSADIVAVKAETSSIQSDTNDIQTRLPAALTGAGNMKADTLAIDGSVTAADRLQQSAEAIVFGTVGSASTTTNIVTSALDPSAAVTDQYKGRIVIFDNNTTTPNLRGQATDITGSTSGGQLTVSALTTAPVSGDTFVIV